MLLRHFTRRISGVGGRGAGEGPKRTTTKYFKSRALHYLPVACWRTFSTTNVPRAKKEKTDKPKGVLLADEWNDGDDPTGWWMTEKMDGVRGYWTGQKFYSRQGKEIVTPDWYTKDFPKAQLDGELWHPGGFIPLTSTIRSKDLSSWKDIIYWVFDVPSHTGAFEERLKFLQDLTKPDCLKVIPVTQCTGKEHLKEFFDSVTGRDGEGIMLRKPTSLYEIGRTQTLFKMKAWHDSEVKYVGLNHSSRGLLCQTPNGEYCVIRCSGADFSHPPAEGTILTVKHNGHWKSGKPKYPYFYRVRRDLNWDDVVKQYEIDKQAHATAEGEAQQS